MKFMKWILIFKIIGMIAALLVLGYLGYTFFAVT